jgi:hypothetical protein
MEIIVVYSISDARKGSVAIPAIDIKLVIERAISKVI